MLTETLSRSEQLAEVPSQSSVQSLSLQCTPVMYTGCLGNTDLWASHITIMLLLFTWLYTVEDI